MILTYEINSGVTSTVATSALQRCRFLPPPLLARRVAWPQSYHRLVLTMLSRQSPAIPFSSREENVPATGKQSFPRGRAECRPVGTCSPACPSLSGYFLTPLNTFAKRQKIDEKSQAVSLLESRVIAGSAKGKVGGEAVTDGAATHAPLDGRNETKPHSLVSAMIRWISFSSSLGNLASGFQLGPIEADNRADVMLIDFFFFHKAIMERRETAVKFSQVPPDPLSRARPQAFQVFVCASGDG